MSEAVNPDSEPAAEVIRLVDEARALRESQQPAESIRKALERAEGAFGPGHAMVAWVLENQASLETSRGRPDLAIPSYRRALAIHEVRSGPAHPDTLRLIEGLAAALFQAQPRDQESDDLALRAIATHEAAGRDDPMLAELIAAVAFRRFWIGRCVEAEPMFLRALAMQERLLGPGNPSTAETAQRLAVMYDKWGFDNDPLPCYRKALTGFEEAHDDDHPAVFEARFRLAECLRRRGFAHEAVPLFERLAETLAERPPAIGLGSVHWMLGEICDFLRDVGRDSEVEAVEEWAASYSPFLEMSRSEAVRVERAHGLESAELAEALGHLANACAFEGLADEAEDIARRILAIQQARLGPDDPATVEAAGRLAKIRDLAESNAENRPARPRLGRLVEKPFGSFSAPWADERRADLIRSYFESLAEPDDEDPTGAVEAITSLTFLAELDDQWDVILELIAEAPQDDGVLQAIAAGPLEGLLGRFDAEVIDRVEAEAALDPKFRRVLSGTWQHGMSDPTWLRVRKIQATEPHPLPEIREIPRDRQHS